MKQLPATYQFIELLAAIAFFVPVCISLYKKQIRNSFFIPFLIYWTWGGLINFIFVSGIISNKKILLIIERAYNLIDAPLLLCLLFFAFPPSGIKQTLKWLTPVYIAAEVIFILATGLNGIAETMLVGIGVLTTLVCLVAIVSFNLWKTKKQNPGNPKMFIYYALLFEYGVSVITFIFNYIFPESNNLPDSFLIFHIAVIITILIASYGLLSYSPRLASTKPKYSKRKEPEAEIRFL